MDKGFASTPETSSHSCKQPRATGAATANKAAKKPSAAAHAHSRKNKTHPTKKRLDKLAHESKFRLPDDERAFLRRRIIQKIPCTYMGQPVDNSSERESQQRRNLLLVSKMQCR